MKPSLIRTQLIALSMIALVSACAPSDQPRVATPATTSVVKPVPEADLLVRGGILLDMVADEPNPRPVKAIVIREGEIDSIIAADSIEPLPPAARTINAGANYILPGLIDSHVHFAPIVTDAAIIKRLSLFYGVTSLFDTGPCGDVCEETGLDVNSWIGEYKDFMNSPVSSGPTLYVTGQRIDGPEGVHPLGHKVKNEEEIVEYLDFLVDFGTDGIKVELGLPPELQASILKEAKARNLPVVGNIHDARESITAGIKFIEHMTPVVSSLLSGEPPNEKLDSPVHDHLMDMDKAPDLIKFMVENEVFLNPTIVGRYGFFTDAVYTWAMEDEKSMQFGGLLSDLPQDKKSEVLEWWDRIKYIQPDTLATYKTGHEKVKAFLRLFSAAGGKLLASTYAGREMLIGISLHREMEMLVDAGITPYQSLLAATRWPAEMMYKDKVIGTVEPGKKADIIITAANPVENVSAARDILYVISRGNVRRSPEDCSTIFPPISMSCAK